MKLQGRALEQVAGAYALGTLSSRTRRRFEAHLSRDIEARRAWQKWEARLSVLTADIPTVRPSDNTWSAIEKRLDGPRPRAKSQVRWLLVAALVVGIAFALVWRKVSP